MKQLFKDSQFICTTFTMVTLGVALASFFTGAPAYLSRELIFTNLIFIIILDVSTHLLDLIPFNSRVLWQMSRFFLQFGLFIILLSSLYQHYQISLREWMPQSILIYLFVYVILMVYYQKKAKLDAEEINRLLEKRSAG